MEQHFNLRGKFGAVLLAAALGTGMVPAPSVFAATPEAAADSAAPAANTDAPPAVQTMPGVEVKQVRDPALLPYSKAYEYLTRVNGASAGRVHLTIRVLSAKTHAPVPELEIRLVGTRDFGALPLASDGTLTVPLNEEALHDGADLMTNQKKGTLQLHATISPALDHAAPLTYADIQAAIRAGKDVRAEILPWYLRVLVPRISGVALCFAEPGLTVTARTEATDAAPAITRAADDETEDEDGNKLYCANFGADEKKLSAATVFSAAKPWHIRFAGSWL